MEEEAHKLAINYPNEKIPKYDYKIEKAFESRSDKDYLKGNK